MPHDLGMALGYDGHQSHSHYLILSAGHAGFGPRELALIAQIVRYHRTGRPDLNDLRRSPGPETANWYSAARWSCGWRCSSRPGRTSPSARPGWCLTTAPCSCSCSCGCAGAIARALER
jgi:exopolyphosphatase/pppGpp-phosphohydrolase